MRIVGETAPSDKASHGGYTVRCPCGIDFTVSGDSAAVVCPCGKYSADLLELAAGWWSVSDWAALQRSVADCLRGAQDSNGGHRGGIANGSSTERVFEGVEMPLAGVLVAPSASTAAAAAAPGPKAREAVATSLEYLEDYGQERTYSPGEVIIREGSPGDSMFAILAGIVELTVKDRLVDMLEPGEVFGEMAMLDGKPRSASATATTACRVIRVDRAGFDRLAAERSDFVVFLLRTMSDRIRRLNGILSALVQGESAPR